MGKISPCLRNPITEECGLGVLDAYGEKYKHNINFIIVILKKITRKRRTNNR